MQNRSGKIVTLGAGLAVVSFLLGLLQAFWPAILLPLIGPFLGGLFFCFCGSIQLVLTIFIISVFVLGNPIVLVAVFAVSLYLFNRKVILRQ